MKVVLNIQSLIGTMIVIGNDVDDQLETTSQKVTDALLTAIKSATVQYPKSLECNQDKSKPLKSNPTDSDLDSQK